MYHVKSVKSYLKSTVKYVSFMKFLERTNTFDPNREKTVPLGMCASKDSEQIGIARLKSTLSVLKHSRIFA